MNFYIYRDMLLKQNISSIMEIKRINKVIIHSSTNSTIDNKQNILPYFVAITLCTGQRPVLSRAKKSISSYRLRKGQILGCYVTMGRKVMNNFLNILLISVLPQVRDFSGIKISKNNLSFGIQGYMGFPQLEENYELFESLSGFTVNCVVNVDNRFNNVLLSAYGFPIIIKKI